MNNQPIQFRAADRRDIPALVDLVTSAYRGDDSRAGWTTEADLLDGMRIDGERIQADLDRERSRILIAERDGEMLACAHVMDEDDAGYFGMFAVRPNLQGAGLGKLMLAEAERVAHEDWSLPAMRMTVIDIRSELIAFYERRGYRRTGIRKPFPYGDARYGLPKRDDLRFEILEKSL
ncbi:GNAT family N-acetyltransferase [Solilutibacter silvestris]|uniref:GNAT family N-acetyltransferase n=1 Tax=Solilutibacter silvestris TaxID=1645665 RepID=UPI003D35252F